MAEEGTDHGPTAAWGGIVAELAAAGFADACEIGHGGSGVVYRCHQASLGRTVAIKVLALDLDDDNRERFLREGYAMGGLSGHPNIVNVLQVGVTASGRPYIVMPYHSADSLAQRLRRVGPIPWPEALRIGVKLCGALETSHNAGTLHRDIKPANVLLTDYGEAQLTDFGIARIVGGYETATGFFTGTMAYTAPEVLAGRQPTVAADVYSLGATLYAIIAGNAAHERHSGEDLITHYMRITTTPVPDMRPGGIPADVCAVIERAMSLDPAKRQASAAEFGRELQAAQRHNGLPPDSMAIPSMTGEHPLSSPAVSQRPPGEADLSEPPYTAPGAPTATIQPPVSASPRPGPSGTSGPPLQPVGGVAAGTGEVPTNAISTVNPVTDPSMRAVPGPGSELPPPQPVPGRGPAGKKRILLVALAAVAVLSLVIGGVYFVMSRGGSRTDNISGGGTDNASGGAPSITEAQAGWQPITNARIARAAVATTQSDGTIWISGGLDGNGGVSVRHEGYDPAIDTWKGGDDLPVPVEHAMSVTWQGNPVVLGGVQAAGANERPATDRMWRLANSRWVELPHMLQPRAAAAAAVVGNRIIVTGGIDANGALLKTTEIFDGNTWTLGAAIPTARQMLGGVSDGKLMYAVGGTNGNLDVTTVEAYDPAANTWTSLPALPQARSDLGVAIADGRLVAVGGLAAGQVLKSVAVFDLATKTWAALPDMGTARHGMAVAAVAKSVYAIGGSTGVGDSPVISSAEALKLAARKLQPVSQWRSLPDAPTARLQPAWTVLDNKIWIFGGLRMGMGDVLQTVESYDPQTGGWQTEPSLPIPLHHATAATYRGQVVVIGGASDNIARASNKVFVLRSGSWAELPSLGHARAAAAAAVVGDKLIVAGGQNDKKIVPQTEVFDGQSWKQAADLPTPREHLAAVSDGSYFYALGGRFLSSDKNSAAFERFDPKSGKWIALPDMPSPHGSFGAAFIDGRIVAVGGEEPTRVIAAADMFDIADGKWTTLTPMPTPRHAEVVAAVGRTVYCIGGANRPTHEGAVATVETLDFS
ncbi:serine/threonine-protein kinase [Mycobacterium sp. 852002-51057_SCH5723018]|uniref:serine/threonine-protein kinase n=1 Tax=Mycobacterium sp. 852002-51057_SCH5723018 TaxID=1834094 RepID=UPI0008024FAD|nr:serine/threonine-protein kinase [Mycobacterium sp. 852002-51057_SCH5723018]OBG29123.1 protein kinase [Mycobacterium sp. 852002-51057_SCH5723018]